MIDVFQISNKSSNISDTFAPINTIDTSNATNATNISINASDAKMQETQVM